MSTQGGPNVRRPGAILETSLKRGRIFSFPLISSHLLPFRSVGRYWLRGRVGFGLGRGGNPGLIVIMVEGCHPGWEGPSVSSLIAAEGAETAELWAALPQRGRGSAGLAVRPAGGRNPDGFALARMDFSVPLSILLNSAHLPPFRLVGRYWLRGRVGFGLGGGWNPGLVVIIVEVCHPGWEGPSVSSLTTADLRAIRMKLRRASVAV